MCTIRKDGMVSHRPTLHPIKTRRPERGQRLPVGWRIAACSTRFMVAKYICFLNDALLCRSASPSGRAGAGPVALP